MLERLLVIPITINEMHTTNTRYTRFIHNGGFDGNVEMFDMISESRIGEVPFDDIKALVAQYVRSERIRRIEGADDHAILFDPLPRG